MRLEVRSRKPAGPAVHPTPLLFVHGAWHGAWCWDHGFLERCAGAGFEVHALSLRGHGQSEGREGLKTHRLKDYVADVAEVAATLRAPPVLVGHSMGGAVTQLYLERHPAAGAALLASMPQFGVYKVTLGQVRHHPLDFLEANLTWSLQPLIRTPAQARALFFSKAMPEEQVAAYHRELQDESYLAFLDMLAFDLPSPPRVKSPVLLLGGEADTIFPPEDQRALAAAYGTTPELFPGMAHDLMLDPGWEQVADRVVAWVKGLPARS
jgi:pimeloyl-ACP methyl ester carboxylesterase